MFHLNIGDITGVPEKQFINKNECLLMVEDFIHQLFGWQVVAVKHNSIFITEPIKSCGPLKNKGIKTKAPVNINSFVLVSNAGPAVIVCTLSISTD